MPLLERETLLDRLLSMTPRTLIRCLTELARVDNRLLLRPSEALFWLIGHYDSLTIEQAREEEL
jgi:hypothetical protein